MTTLLKILWIPALMIGSIALAQTSEFSSNVFKYHQLAHQELDIGLESIGNTGTLSYIYNIKVPDARAHMQPSLRLQYSSLGENGPLGVGWTLNVPYIERRAGRGGLDYAGKAFDLVEGHSRHELVYMGPNPAFDNLDEYRIKHEDGRGLRFFRYLEEAPADTVWLAVNKDQELSYYGKDETAQVRAQDRDAKRRIYRWHLSEEVDRYNNKILYSYSNFAAVNYGYPKYLTKIIYAQFTVNFIYSGTRLDARPDYRAGFSLVYSYELFAIDCQVWMFDRARYAFRYELSYQHSKSSDRLLLTSITQLDEEDNALPSQNFVYAEQTQDNPLNLEVVHLADTFSDYNPLGGVGAYEKQWHLADFNGDGRMDVLHLREENAIAVWLGKADGTFDILPNWSGCGPLAGAQAAPYKYRLQIGDFNGDGRTDVLHTVGNHSANIWFGRVDGNGNFNYFNVVAFSGPTLSCMPTGAPGPFYLPDDVRQPWGGANVQFVNHIADFNADGMDDILGFYPQLETLCELSDYKPLKGRFFIYFSNGDGTFSLKEWRIKVSGETWLYDFSLPTRGDILSPGGCDNNVNAAVPRQYGVAVADINGDGLPDLVHPKGTQKIEGAVYNCTSPLVVFLNRGLRANPTSNYDIWFERIPCQLSNSFIKFGSLSQYDPVQFQYSDNGDGILDMLSSNESSSPMTLAMLLNHNDWYTGVDQYQVFEWTDAGRIRDHYDTVDANGDRISDSALRTYGRSSLSGVHPNVFIYRGRGDGETTLDPDSTSLRDWYAPVHVEDSFLVADFTGDGKTDFLSMYPATYGGIAADSTVMYKSAGSLPDLLQTIKRDERAVVDIQYSTASGGIRSGAPSVIPVVQSITYHDGLNNDIAVSYSFSGGRYDAIENAFAGFERTVESYADGSYAVSYYNLDRDRKGTCARRAHYSSSGLMMKRDATKWAILGQDYPRFACIDTMWTSVYGGADSVVSIQAFAYDPVHYGLLSKVVSGTGSEEIALDNSYTNLDLYMWKLQSESIQGAIHGAVKSKYYAYYTSDTPQGHKGSLYQEIDAYGYPEARTTTYVYTELGNVHDIQRQGEASTRYFYDPSYTYPDTVVTYSGASVYWAERFVNTTRFSVPVDAWDKNGNYTYMDYDEYGRFISSTKYSGPQASPELVVAQTLVERDDWAFPLKSETGVLAGIAGESPNFVVTREYHDLLGRLIQTSVVADTAGGVTRYLVERYGTDAAQNLVWKRGPFFADSLGLVQEADIPVGAAREEKYFDPLGRLVQERRSTHENGIAERTYTYAGAQLIVEDEDARLTRIVRDHLGRVTAVKEVGAGGVEATTTYVVDAAGNILSISDMLGNTYTREFDLLGRLKDINHPDLGELAYTYSAAGAILSTTEADGFHIWSDRDALGRCYRTRYERDSSVSNYTYDAPGVANSLGLVTSRQNAQARWGAKSFDPLGNCLEDTVSIAGVSIQSVMRYEYDESSRQTSIRFVGGDGFHSDYEYYPGSSLVREIRAESVSDLVTLKVSDYSAFGRPGHLEYYHNDQTTPFIVVDYTLSEADDRIYGILARNQSSDGQPQNDLLNRSYSYSAAGDLLVMIDYKKGDILNKPNNEYVYTCQYDERHRLRKVFEAGSTSPAIETKYDAGGRITEKKFGTRKLTYQYTGSRPHAVSGLVVGTSAYPVTYDQRGNTTSDVGLESILSPINRAFNYGPENRVDLVTYGPPGVPEPTEVTFAYGPDGMRVRKSVTGGLSTLYYNRYFELDNYVDGSNYDRLKYVFLGRQRIMQRGPTGTQVLVSDMLGSVNLTCDSAGVPAYSVDYDAWGRPKDAAGTGYQKWQYTGQEREQGFQLYNYNAREYDAARGTFLAPDAIDQNLYDPQLLNRYSYARDNPEKYTDASGAIIGELVDVGFVVMDVHSMVSNMRHRQYGAALADAGGMIVDGVLTVVPVAPAVGGRIIRAAREGDNVLDTIRSIKAGGLIRELRNRVKKIGQRIIGRSGAERLEETRSQGEAAAGRSFDDILSNQETMERWLKSSHRPDRPLSKEDARKLWKKLIEAGKQPRLDEGHEGRKWDMLHISVDGTHIPVEPGFAPPGL